MSSPKRKKTKPLRASDPARIERESLAQSKWCEPCGKFFDAAEPHCPQCGNAKQECGDCGRIFYSEAPGKCAICSGGKQPSAAERLLRVKACAACGETFGAEYSDCPACAKAAKAKTAKAAAAKRDLENPHASIRFLRIEEIAIAAQTRERFDQAELEQLAASIEAHGLLQPVIVRANPALGASPSYLLVAGERRIRAVKQLGWQEIAARDLGFIDDAQALVIQGHENLKRADLNEIERANWYQRMTAPTAEGGGGLTQRQLGEQEKLSQSHVSNTIRLLKLPPWARQHLMEEERTKFSAKHAIELLHFEQFPTLLAAMAKATQQFLKEERGLGTAESYRDELHELAWDETAAISDEHWDSRAGKHVKFRVAAEALAGLTLVSVRRYRGRGKEFDERAIEKKQALKLLDAAREAAAKAAQDKGEKKEKREAAQAKELTPAEQKQRAADQARQLAARVESWFYDWLRVLASTRLMGDPVSHDWLFLWALVESPGHTGRRFALLKRAVDERCGPQRLQSFDAHATAKLVDQLAAAAPHDAAQNLAFAEVQFLRGLLVDEEGSPVESIPGEVLMRLARVMRLDLAGEWRDDRKSAMRERFWGLHSKEQLLALGRELKVPLLETQTKAVMIANLLGQAKPLPLPKCLAPLVAKAQATEGTEGAEKGKKKASRKSERAKAC